FVDDLDAQLPGNFRPHGDVPAVAEIGEELGYGITRRFLRRAHCALHGANQCPRPATSFAAASGPHDPGAYGCTGGGESSSGCITRHCSSTASWRVNRMV